MKIAKIAFCAKFAFMTREISFPILEFVRPKYYDPKKKTKEKKRLKRNQKEHIIVGSHRGCT